MNTKKFNWQAAAVLAVLMLLTAGQSQVSDAAEITPSDVFSVMDFVDRQLDSVIQIQNFKNFKAIHLSESNLRPMHPYQMGISTIDALIELQKKEQVRPIPKIVATPTQYTPGDVILLGEMLLTGIKRTFSELEDELLERQQFSNKTPTDVFGKVVSIFTKIKLLSKSSDISPNETYAESVRAVSDVKSILSQIDPAKRYRIDAPVSPIGLTPADVFQECLLLRKDITTLAEKLKLTSTPVPVIDKSVALHPADVFIQFQVIIAELNYLKMGTGTVSSTPLAIPVTGKNPSDVHQQVALARYLIAQVIPLKEMVAKKKF